MNSMVAVLAQQPPSRRRGDWPLIAKSEMKAPVAKSGAVPTTDRLSSGTQITATIGDESIEGTYQGFDLKGRPVIVDGNGDRRVGSWDAIQGDAPTIDPLANLSPVALAKPPAKLAEALEAALELEVCGAHTAREYVDAFHAEGYAVYVVGGAIRDAIRRLQEEPDASIESIVAEMKDIDIVTTAPPPVSRRIAAEVAPEYDEGAVWSPPIVDQYGAVLVGGAKAGLPNPEGLDIVSIRTHGNFEPAEKNRDTGETFVPYTFGHDLAADSKGRDFACNAVYYDPFNAAIIDPTGHGIADAQRRHLRVARTECLDKDDNLSLRFWKFRMRGYTTDETNMKIVRSHANRVIWGPRWQTINNLARIAPKDAREPEGVKAFIENLGKVMAEDGMTKLFTKRVAPMTNDVTKRIQKRFKKAAGS